MDDNRAGQIAFLVYKQYLNSKPDFSAEYEALALVGTSITIDEAREFVDRVVNEIIGKDIYNSVHQEQLEIDEQVEQKLEQELSGFDDA